MKLFEKMNCVGSASECGRPDPAGLCLDPCVNAISCEQLFRPPVIFLPTLELPRHVIYRSRSRPRSHLLAGEALTLVSWIPKGPYLPHCGVIRFGRLRSCIQKTSTAGHSRDNNI
ncbi:hypothetical protein HZ326_19375 [Fusarium oxysporum f. sp. albedinis]|nr:hypothetical protein HZ326_19375 [Fusarium oxysporum f. sp. albedinis]